MSIYIDRYSFFLAPESLPSSLKNLNTATLVRKTLKKDKDMPALVATSPGLRNGVIGQDLNAVITNLTANGARNYNNSVFIFANGNAIGTWKSQIGTNIPWYES